ncbi:MAG: rhodanese-like domain-containing protein [Deltaproteobacteria bacterium]|nr:rhodanese-like domain-containing protein [Deltaproteobacteria bacterium]
MRKILLAAALLAGCTKDTAPHHTVANVSVDQADQQLTTGTAQAVDANGDATRKRMGVVPGAVLLTDSESFQLSELPKDKGKPLVFYCANTACGASHQAAEKALTAGYEHVEVMSDGIAGWVRAGKKTQSI